MPSKTPFVLPQRPEDAVVRLTILVESGEGDSLTLAASLTPGSRIWDHEQVERIFRDARTIPVVGSYVLVTSQSGTVVTSAPEGVDAADRRALVFVLGRDLEDVRLTLVQTLRAFPPAKIIADVAREVVSKVSLSSLGRNMLLDATPVVDARSVAVEGVECIHCGFGLEGLFAAASEAIRGRRSEERTIKLGLVERDSTPVVLVGYLGHDNQFAAELNTELALRLKLAVETVTEEVMTEVLVKAEYTRRMAERTIDAVLETYGIDPDIIAAEVDAIEADARAEFAPPDDEEELDEPTGEVEDTGNGADEVDPTGEPVAVQAQEPAPAGT